MVVEALVSVPFSGRGGRRSGRILLPAGSSQAHSGRKGLGRDDGDVVDVHPSMTLVTPSCHPHPLKWKTGVMTCMHLPAAACRILPHMTFLCLACFHAVPACLCLVPTHTTRRRPEDIFKRQAVSILYFVCAFLPARFYMSVF